MLKLKDINKSYTTGDFTQQALKNVSLNFRKSEFVAILGPSGSGKTTLLNIVGGLDRYDKGDLIINGKSTKKFRDTEWDAYRNNCVGFVFQSYNLIGHISILDNVEMGMTLSGVSASKRRKKAMEVLDKVGLSEHSHKKPNQLSGGQMQRVAIARALANDPDIILADEPTGALDSTTSVQIMELIKEIAKDKLVIMVTHNADLANDYATRVVEFKDGMLVKDSKPIKNQKEKDTKFKIKKTAMSFLTALKLSFNNIKTKKGRTLLTAFASSIGIIGIALILSLSNGFDIQIDQFERDSLSSMPITISEQAMQMDEETIQKIQKENKDTTKKYPSEKKIYPQESMAEAMTHTNVLDEEYINYIEKLDNNLIGGLSYNSMINFNIVTKSADGYKPITSQMYTLGPLIEKNSDNNKYEFMDNTFDLLEGNYPTKKEEMVIIVDSKNRITKDLLSNLGFDPEAKSINFDDIIGKEFKLLPNNSYYKSLGQVFVPNTDYESLYSNENAVTLKIAGIIRGKEDKELITTFSSGVGYTKELLDYVVSANKDSDIVKKQGEVNYNIMTGEFFQEGDTNNTTNKQTILSYLGGSSVPYAISIYPKDFNSKDKVVDYLEKYNKNKAADEQILFTDMGKIISNLSGNIMDAITVVLIAFSAISLIVSSIMIGIITYISVLERTKEIGVLRALGARKKDVTRVFNAETTIIGLCSGLLGIVIARLLLFPANAILYSITDLANVAVLNPVHALILIIISLILTLIGGFIPAIVASRKDPVEALRTE